MEASARRSHRDIMITALLRDKVSRRRGLDGMGYTQVFGWVLVVRHKQTPSTLNEEGHHTEATPSRWRWVCANPPNSALNVTWQTQCCHKSWGAYATRSSTARSMRPLPTGSSILITRSSAFNSRCTTDPS